MDAEHCRLLDEVDLDIRYIGWRQKKMEPCVRSEGRLSMNGKQIIILIGAFIVAGLILWHDLPIEFPGIIFKFLMLFVKLSIVFAVALFAFIFAGGKKKL